MLKVPRSTPGFATPDNIRLEQREVDIAYLQVDFGILVPDYGCRCRSRVIGFIRPLPAPPDMRNRLKIKWLLVAAAVVCIGSGVYYADLLRSAFLRNPIPRSPESIARGRQLFAKDCAVCHGAEGRGDGVAAAVLPHRPDDLSRIAPPPIFPDGVVAYRIINGVKMMPAFKSTLSENEVWDLLNFIRSLARAK
jgi:mono/diheme cytochrome c family protein